MQNETARSPVKRDATATGLRVLAALDAGRAKINELRRDRAEALRAAVKRLADDDAARGKPPRGRAGRIAKKLKGLASRRHIQRILDQLSCMSDAPS